MRFIKLLCPRCGKHLLDVGEDACGNIRPFCKGCRTSVIIKLGGVKLVGK